MGMPDREMMILPVLQRLSQRASTTTEMVDAMAELYNLTDDERRMKNEKGKRLKFNNLVDFAFADLTMAGLIARKPTKSYQGPRTISELGRLEMVNPPDRITKKYLNKKYATPRSDSPNPDESPKLNTNANATGSEESATTPRATARLEPIISAPTNLILYGPPGTGKTYATVAEAVQLCGKPLSTNRTELKRSYDTLVEAGQVGFVTFHQNYSYEDFVEGLRPTNGAEGGDIQPGFRLEPRRGIFREISALAEHAQKTAGLLGGFDIGDRQVFQMSLGRAGAEGSIFDAAIAGNYVVLGNSGDIDWSDSRYDGAAGLAAIRDTWNERGSGTVGDISQLQCFRNSMEQGDLVVVSCGNSDFRAIGEIISPYRYQPTSVRGYNHIRTVRWLLVPDERLPVNTIYDKPFAVHGCARMDNDHLKRSALVRLLPGKTVAMHAAPDQFVLIIDEINRANISKVFGELITLLEPDKRIGAENELKVKLPYSGETFGVPANLHIVGTMNTADRSIALLDTALRRRFKFRELMPDPTRLLKEVDGINLQAMLRCINERIEYLFDREHQIGHSYFMGCKDKAAIDDTVRSKIIPLLSEYFFEDWDKVACVLGDTKEQGGFLNCRRLEAPDGFAAVG